MHTSSSTLRPETPRDAPTAPAEILLDALVAAYALMAHADGEVASAERRRLFSIIRDTPALQVFSRDDVAQAAAEHEANYRLDPELAQQLAWEKIDPIAGQRRVARVLVAVCRELIPADGVAHPAEYRTLADIKSRLGIDDLPPHA